MKFPYYRAISAAIVVVQFLCVYPTIAAESYAVGDARYKAVRNITTTKDSKTAIVVANFYHHGLIEKATDVVCVAKTGRTVVPTRLLQVGPGDFCRVAFCTIEKCSDYYIYYGHAADSKPNSEISWTANVGLLLETRQWENCDLNHLDSLKNAFEKAKPIGTDYVTRIHHTFNPFALKSGPFLSRYSGTLKIPQAGDFFFLASSQDASFALTDGNVIASHHGWHGPRYDANPEFFQKTHLTQGSHSFEYYHGAAGDLATMSLFWSREANGSKSPVEIMPELFGCDRVAHIVPTAPELAAAGTLPDFMGKITGFVPISDVAEPLIAITFENLSTKTTQARGKPAWNFGDGQTSTDTNPVHVYLKPGDYAVKLSFGGENSSQSVVHTIRIEQPNIPSNAEKLHTLDQYLQIVSKYDTKKLDAQSALRLIEAYLFKIETIKEIPAVAEMLVEFDSLNFDEKSKRTNEEIAREKEQTARLKTVMEQIMKIRKLAVESGKNCIHENMDKTRYPGNHAMFDLAELAGEIARDFTDQGKIAEQIYYQAAQRLSDPRQSAKCFALAADVALSELNDEATAKKMLGLAMTRLPSGATGPEAQAVYRIQGDFLSSTGDANGAKQVYKNAAKAETRRKSYVERTALEGSYSRSAEGFIRKRNFDRAIIELRNWQDEFPDAAVDGYIVLLFAKYRLEKGQFALAVKLVDRLQTLNPDNGYLDQLIMVGVDAQIKLNNKAGAVAMLHGLIKDHPGSSMIEQAKTKIAELER